MAETYFFFNSIDDDRRVYSAEHFTILLSMLFSNGVCGAPDSLQAFRDQLSITVKAGGAIIDGHFYNNSAPKTFTVTPPASGVRYDRIVLRFDLSTNRIALLLRKGSSSAAPEIIYNSQFREIPICKLIAASSTIVSVTDERSFITLKGSG